VSFQRAGWFSSFLPCGIVRQLTRRLVPAARCARRRYRYDGDAMFDDRSIDRSIGKGVKKTVGGSNPIKHPRKPSTTLLFQRVPIGPMRCVRVNVNGNEPKPKHASFQVPFLKISCVANTVSLMSAQCSAVISLWSDVPLSMNDMGVPFHVVIASSQVPRTRIEEQYNIFYSVLFYSYVFPPFPLFFRKPPAGGSCWDLVPVRHGLMYLVAE